MWDAFKEFIFWGIQAVFNFVGDWGLAIILVTILFRVLLIPLMRGQIKSSYQMQKIQPQLQELQTKYADDPMRQQEEMQKLYAEAKFNPVAGCLPIFLQMPIFMALFQVLREMPSYIEKYGLSEGNYEFYNLVPNLTYSPAESFAMGMGTFIPYLVLLIVFAGATFLPMILQQINAPNSQQRRQTLMISGFMSIFMLFIGWSSPAGVLLFWGVSSLIGVAQQQLTTRALKRADAKKEAEEPIELKPVQVEVTRKAKKKRPTKSH